MVAVLQERYSRQVALPQIGQAGQRRLATATVTIVGCGGLGTVTAGLLARAGVGRLRLVDGDVVELTNLHRQALFDEADLGRPKVIAAAEKLHAANSGIVVEPVTARLEEGNAPALLAGSTLVLDGTDNDATRYLINSVCVGQGIPWIFAAVDAAYGLVMTIVSGRTPCFQCVFGKPLSPPMPPQGGKCSLGTASCVIAAIQAGQALRLLLDERAYTRGLLYVDAWAPYLETFEVSAPDRGCPVCGG